MDTGRHNGRSEQAYANDDTREYNATARPRLAKLLGLVTLLVLLAIGMPMGVGATTLLRPLPSYERVDDWTVVEVTGTQIRASTYVALKNIYLTLENTSGSECLIYMSRKYGINLSWSSTCAPNIKFVRPSGTRDALNYGESLALYVKGGGYVRYRERDWGINLVWSTTPVYEWEIHGGQSGAAVRPTSSFALYNRVERDHVIYCERDYGINLKWANDCNREAPTCQMFADRPIRDGGGPIIIGGALTGAGGRINCSNSRTVTVVLRQDRPWLPDRTLAEATQTGANVTVPVHFACTENTDMWVFIETRTNTGEKVQSERLLTSC